MFTHILFPTDGSQNANQALSYLKEIATKYQAKVTVLHVYELPLSVMLSRYDMMADTIQEIEDKLQQAGSQMVNKAQLVLMEQDIVVETHVVQGNTGETIIDFSRDKNCDLILMGTHGWGSIRSFLMGSVSYYVLHHAQVPVLLIPLSDKSHSMSV